MPSWNNVTTIVAIREVFYAQNKEIQGTKGRPVRRHVFLKYFALN